MATNSQPGHRLLERNPLFWAYGVASVSFGIKNHAFSYLLLIFSTNVIGLSGYQASIALAIAMLWDAVTDLLLGHWSDKTHSPSGPAPPLHVCSIVDPSLFILGHVQPDCGSD